LSSQLGGLELSFDSRFGVMEATDIDRYQIRRPYWRYLRDWYTINATAALLVQLRQLRSVCSRHTELVIRRKPHY